MCTRPTQDLDNVRRNARGARGPEHPDIMIDVNMGWSADVAIEDGTQVVEFFVQPVFVRSPERDLSRARARVLPSRFARTKKRNVARDHERKLTNSRRWSR